MVIVAICCSNSALIVINFILAVYFMGRKVTKINLQEEFENIFLTMIVTVFNFFQIHGKVIPRYAPIVIQNMFSITPKSLNPVDMVIGLITYKAFGMFNYHMLAKSLQRLIPPKRIGVIDRSLAGMGLDMCYERFCRDRRHHFGVDPSVPLQQAEYDTFTTGATPTLPLRTWSKLDSSSSISPDSLAPSSSAV